MAFERKQMDICVKACTMDILTYNCVTTGNYRIHSAVGVYPVGEEGRHTFAHQSTKCSPCTTHRIRIVDILSTIRQECKFVTHILMYTHTH